MITALRNDRHLSVTCAALGLLLLFAHMNLVLHDMAPGHTEEGAHCVICAAWDRAGVATVDAAGTSPPVLRQSMAHSEPDNRFAATSFIAIAARGPPPFV